MMDIKDIQGNILLTTPINEGSKRKFMLMKEDYIILTFHLQEPVYFKLGDYVDDSHFGLFEICDIQKPTFNTSTAGYDYELRLDAHYWKWKNKVFKYTPEAAGQEASWNLTATLDIHAGVILRNLKALGYQYNGQDFVFSIDGTVENKSQLMSYDNINILDACFEMAKKWDCECWVTENVIHFGRCEFGDSVDFEIGKNVEEMNRSDSQTNYATRIYAFGSTRNIPANYRTVDDSVVVNGVVQKRLMLPAGTPYVDARPDMRTEEAIEQVVIFDDVYPRRIGSISDVTTKEYTDTNEDTGEVTKWNAYRFKDVGINFSEKYTLPGQELRVRFESGLLNGMEFAVKFNPEGKPEKLEDGSWNPEAQVWEIVRNEDYGRPLPDDVLRPQAEHMEGNVSVLADTYALSGFDSTSEVFGTMVSAAEKELKEKAESYVEKSKIDPSTYENKMMPDCMIYSDGTPKLFGAGDRVNLINKAYFEDGRQSRIIGFEYSLDKPYDHPVYTVGETASYSRLGEIEEKVDSLTIKGQTYTSVGGGSGIYIIRTNDSTPPSNSNVYSALRIDDMMKAQIDKCLRKDQPDSTPYPIDFMGGLSINSKRIGDVIRYYDDKKPVATDANIYSALMTDQRIEDAMGNFDDRYLRKDKEDFAHKHITFEEGITVYQLAETMNLDVKNLATIAQAVVSILRSSKFVDGFAGEGYRIWQDIANGDWCMTLDRLTVRKVMTIYELVLQKIRSVGGMVVISAANGKVKSIEHIGNSYVFEFEDTNTFVANDLMRCQVFSSAGLKYYWVKIASVSGEYVTVPVSEFNGVVPTAGDECVLMGNTTNKRRQNLIMISATEDGQPRFDCLDGVKSKSFEGCLKVRVGALDGISDSRFPANMQPSGHGLYGNNCFLTGIFVLSNGKDVMTMFSIIEGMIKSEISSIRNEINVKDNYLSNAAFTNDLSYWTGSNDIRLFTVNGKFLYFNNNFYSNKKSVANIVPEGNKNVLRLKNSHIIQANSDLALHPEFDLYDITETDSKGNETVTGKQYRARMFYVSFKYKVTRPGTLRVYFKNEDSDGFEEYAHFDHTNHLEPTDEFRTMEIAGKWNGTGDFYLSFSGDMYLYSLALADNRLADMEEKFTNRFEATDKKIQANLDEIKKTATKLEEYRSEFLLTARQLQIQFSADLSDAESRITAAYKSYVNLTARDLEIEFSADLRDAESRITEAYTGAINMSAKGLETKFSADITDMESGITSAYKSYVSLTAQGLKMDFSTDLTDLRTGVTSAYTAAINASAQGLRTDFNSSVSDLNGKITSHTSSFHVTSAQISAMVSATDNISNTIRTAGWITTADGNSLYARKDGIISAINQTAESVTIDAARINLNGVVTANKTFKINLDGSMEATGGRIGGFRIVGNGLTNSNENGSYTNDAYVIFRNDTHGCFAGIGGNILPSSTGLRAVGRFENHDKSDWFGMNETNYACIFSAKNAVNNYAIYMENGVIGGMAVKVRQISATTTLNHSDCWVSCYNTSAINVYLPSNPQVGKLIYVMRVNNAKVTVQGNGKSIIYRNNNVTSADINQNREIDIFMYDGQFWMNGWFNGST